MGFLWSPFFPFVSHIWVAYGASHGGPSGRRSSATKLSAIARCRIVKIINSCVFPLIDDKNLANERARSCAVIVKKMHLTSRALLNVVCYKDGSYKSRHLNKKKNHIHIYFLKNIVVVSRKKLEIKSELNACQSRLSCSYIHN